MKTAGQGGTVSDSVYQWDKLRSALTLTEWSEEHSNNHALFFDYYLKERPTDSRLAPQWAEDVRPIGRQILPQMAGAYQRYGRQPESAIRRHLFEPLFTALGFHWRENKAGDSATETADSLLYADSDREPDRRRPAYRESAQTAVSHLYRTLANAIIYFAYRNGPIEDSHAGREPAYSLNHRRFTGRQAQQIIRFTTERLSPFVSATPLWDEQIANMPPWPERMAALPAFRQYPRTWSFTESSSRIHLNQAWME